MTTAFNFNLTGDEISVALACGLLILFVSSSIIYELFFAPPCYETQEDDEED